jgi:YfiR/HmsC-like
MRKASPRSKALFVGSWVMLLLAFLRAGETARAQPAQDEYKVKAGFIFHFAQLIDWPQDPPPGTDSSLFLCTLGEDPFQGGLESTVEGKTIRTRVLRIRHLKRPDDIPGCSILFLGKAEGSHIHALLTDLHNAPILTVGETPGFLGEGGMICFRSDKDRVRFDINLDAARTASLKVGSRLLMMAQIVIGQAPEK